ncbi:4'-phosphopantetheinyl transferase family protein [Streptomyces sp. NPDC002851]
MTQTLIVEPLEYASEPLPAGPIRETEVWLVRADDQATAHLLNAQEKKRAADFRYTRDRLTYTAAHGALRTLLGAYLGEDPSRLTFVREPCPCCGDPHGRPALPGASVHFSLSRTRDVALLGFAPHTIGVDIEVLPDSAAVADVSEVLHPREQEELAVLAPTERRSAFARCWTRKEACLKGTGEGLARGTAATYVSSEANPAPVPGWRLGDVRVPEGYAAAIAVREDTGPAGYSKTSLRPGG